jgi:hypothetical protein
VKRAVLDQMRLREEAMIAELKSIEPHARQARAGHSPTKLDVLMGGIKIHETYLGFLRELLQDLS